MEQGSRTRLVTAVILAAVFASGVLLGLAADSSLSAEAPPASTVVERESADDTGADSAEPDEPEAERRYIYHQVDPNEEQLARIGSIVAEWRARREAFDEESRTRWEEGRRAFVLETRNAIKAALSPEQAAEYQRLLDEWEAERSDESEN